jgi:hypothetical protein
MCRHFALRFFSRFGDGSSTHSMRSIGFFPQNAQSLCTLIPHEGINANPVHEHKVKITPVYGYRQAWVHPDLTTPVSGGTLMPVTIY